MIKLAYLKAVFMLLMVISFLFLCLLDLSSFFTYNSTLNEPGEVNEERLLEVQLETNALNFKELEATKTIKNIKIGHALQTNQPKDRRQSTLCKLNLSKACFSNNIAEVIDSFWVIAPLYSFRQGSVPIMYQLHTEFQNYMRSIGLKFSTIEAIRKDRNQVYMMTKPNNEPEEIQTEYFDDLYLRENFLNVALRKIPNWEYMAWIDAHQVFENPYWWEESVHDMEKYGSVQMFQQLQRLGVSNETLDMKPGSLYVTTFQSKLGWTPLPFYGNAFGIRKEMYEKIGYILDTCVASCCDCLYNNALLDDSVEFYYMNKWSHYLGNFKNWTDQARSVFKGRRKSIRGKLFHLKHEEKFSYFSLLETANKLDFEVDRDLNRNDEFVISLKNPDLRKEIDHINFLSYYSLEILIGFVVLGCAVVIGILVLIVYCLRKRNGYTFRNFHSE